MSEVNWHDPSARMAHARAARARDRSVAVAIDDPAGEIRRFAAADLPEWGVWLTGRLSERAPGINAAALLGKLYAAMASNDFLFIRNDRAVLMVSGAPRFIDGRLVFIEVFAFSRDAVKTDKADYPMLPMHDPAERPLTLLYWRAREWCRSQNATRLFLGQCSDMMPSMIKEHIGGIDCGWISVKL